MLSNQPGMLSLTNSMHTFMITIKLITLEQIDGVIFYFAAICSCFTKIINQKFVPHPNTNTLPPRKTTNPMAASATCTATMQVASKRTTTAPHLSLAPVIRVRAWTKRRRLPTRVRVPVAGINV